MKALVIGANGFLGQHLTRRLTDLNWDVTAVVNQSAEKISFVSHVVTSADQKKLKDSFDVVFLLAAFIPFGSLNHYSSPLFETNVRLVLDTCQQFKKAKIVFASSVAVYGEHTDTITELTSFNNPSAYGSSKLTGEFIVKHNPRYSILRFSSLYGKGMHETFLYRLVKQSKSGKIILFNKGQRKQNYLYITDAVDYCIAAASALQAETYLAVGERSYTNKEVAQIIQKNVPDLLIEYKNGEEGASYIYNNQVSTSKLGFRPAIALEKGLQFMMGEMEQ